MTTTKKITNAVALRIAVAMAKGEDMATACAAEEFTTAEYIAKIEHMANKANEAKPKREKTLTKEQIANLNLARETAATILEKAGTEPVGTLWIMENCKYLPTSQKVTAIMNKCQELGLMEKADPVKGKVMYRAIAPTE